MGTRNSHPRIAMQRDRAYLYAHRDNTEQELGCFVFCEFLTQWSKAAARDALCRDQDTENDRGKQIETGYLETQTLPRQGTLSGRHVLHTCTSEPVLNTQYGVWIPPRGDAHTQHCRHEWVSMRNSVAKDSVLSRCPLLRRREGLDERSVAVVLTFFHLSALDTGLAEEWVPFQRALVELWRGAVFIPITAVDVTSQGQTEIHNSDSRIAMQRNLAYLYAHLGNAGK